MTMIEKKAPESFADRLRLLLGQHHDGNQSEMGRELGTSPQAVNKWLAGDQTPRPAMLAKIAKRYHVTESWLLYGDSTPPPAPRYLLMLVEGEKEAQLLHEYRMGTLAGQRQLLMAAGRIEKKPASELPALPPSALDET